MNGAPPVGQGLFQTATIGALLDGVYDGEMTLAELAAHGDFGLGTFNHLDGEMVAVDGQFHQLRSDGSAAPAAPTVRTPYAAVTFFRPDHEQSINEPLRFTDLERLVSLMTPSPNLFYAIRVDGHFGSVTTRTVSRQSPPFVPLATATDQDAVHRFTDVRGTVVGFRTPAFAQGIAVAGDHLHFLTDTKDGGGHVLDFVVASGTVQIAAQPGIHLDLPRTDAFLHADLTRPDTDAEIRRAEGGRRVGS
ncbi:acetolactate decarboxylase [Streptomyces fractus]|uniref:acetolactate decarboxylase n=1 Tax=Streptomyces fractus TaxID=641806 RepID=UPI003CEE2C70